MFLDKHIFPNSTNDATASHIYFISDSKDGKVIAHQFTTKPPTVFKVYSMFNKRTRTPTYLKHESQKVDFRDGYEVFSGFPKISSKELPIVLQRLKRK